MNDFAETSSGNRISRRSQIKGSDHILISGYTTISANAHLNCDVKLKSSKESGALKLGKFVFIDEDVTITPATETSGESVHLPSIIGSYVMIGKATEVRSVSIGSRVAIGENCKLGDRSTIYDCVVIASNTILPNNTNIPPFSLVYTDQEGLNRYPRPKTPSIIIEPLHESYKRLFEENAKLAYVNSQFTPSEMPRF
ncbi:hypothetical protein WICPIJ_005684 [Wickerhamomyces pijperi]|uniref:Dynactin subunit 5 n=1 Tax=Wickerhamomyces pijperi TaxID=599730 RepID=A0A9P8TM49_WICPI|nr:hypothetical protein WICPIJ_005684 [Wickerhamomyces pijperi]